MKEYIKINEWSIIEDGFHPEHHRISESIFSLGNGRMGQRANFEENYSGDTLPGHYLAGIYLPQEQSLTTSQKISLEYGPINLNAPNWIGISVEVDGEVMDLATCQVISFRRELNMREGYLERTFRARFTNGKEMEVSALRFTSIADDELGAIRYAIMPLNFSGAITLTPYLDAEVENQAFNPQEKNWEGIFREIEPGAGIILAETKNQAYQVCTGMRLQLEKDGTGVETTLELIDREKYVANRLTAPVQENEQLVLYKYAAVVTSENYPKEKLIIACNLALDRATQIGFSEMLEAQAAVWAEKWQECDVIIKGDAKAQQGIRFSLFQLNQAFTGEDERLAITSQGFTGEKSSGSNGDIEIYCFPYFLATADLQVSRNLLLNQYQLLPQGKDITLKPGYSNGPAPYPANAVNKEQNYPGRELPYQKIHRNGAIAYAIYDYIRFTGDADYLHQQGLEILTGISRFFVQSVSWSDEKSKNNFLAGNGAHQKELSQSYNWYTDAIVSWTLEYTLDALQQVKQRIPNRYEEILQSLSLDEVKETAKWQDLINKLYHPVAEEKGGFLQQSDILDNEQFLANRIGSKDLSLLQNTPLGNIQISDYLPPAIVLQGLLLFGERYDLDIIRRNFDNYVGRSQQGSPVLPGLQSILTSKLGYEEKAYNYFLRSARYNLDDFDNNTPTGCHLASMGATWLALTKGFAGMQVIKNQLHFHPVLPEQWQSYSFKIRFGEHLLDISITKSAIKILNQAEKPISIFIYNKEEIIKANNFLNLAR